MEPWFTTTPSAGSKRGRNALLISMIAKKLMSKMALADSREVSMAGFSSPVMHN
jgi:hypothetical protein